MTAIQGLPDWRDNRVSHLEHELKTLTEIASERLASELRLIQEKKELQNKIESQGERIRELEAWINKAHHLDGCIRRRHTYPWRKKEAEPCDCGKISLTETVSLSEAIKRARGGDAPTQMRGFA